jgi:hypothetical protein
MPTLRTTLPRAATVLALLCVGPIVTTHAAPLHPAASVEMQGGAAIPVRGGFVGGGHVVVAPRVSVAPRMSVAPRGAAVVRSGNVVRGGTVVTGPRGNVGAVGRTTVVAPRGRWSRPGWYHWPRGGAMAAGAAIGFLAAASAAAYGPPPESGMCWYYTNPSHTRGFWDYCP